MRENRGQFALLVAVNAFVGAMVGMERTVLPLLAEREFGLASHSAVLSFVVAFGFTKAIANLLAGRAADRWGRRRTLLAGWAAGAPVPFLIIFAPRWEWVIAANILLGVNQGLCWSATLIMKLDLVGPGRRGLAAGLNEASGYLAVSLAALVSGYLGAAHGLRPAPFLVGVVALAAGFSCALFARETKGHVALESPAQVNAQPVAFRQVLARVSWRDRSLLAASQAGLVNNLNDGAGWGLFPLYFAWAGASLETSAALVALYPAVWGLGQLATGPLSDRVGRRWPIVAGLIAQAAALFLLAGVQRVPLWALAMTLLGLGTALVYPTLLGAVSDHADPAWRGSAIGVYRLWRDLGYAIGAILAGAMADLLGISSAIRGVAALTFVSGLVVWLWYREG